MKRKQRVQFTLVLAAAVVWLLSFLWNQKSVSEEISASHSDDYRLSTLRESLAAELDRSEIFHKGYVTLLVGWALLHGIGKTSVAELIDAVVDDQLPSLALFYAEDRMVLYEKLPDEVAKVGVLRNPENFKIWQLVQPKNCRNILPLYLNTKTGAFICGDTSSRNFDLWRRGLPHLPFSPFTGPALAMDPEIWTSKQWIKYLFQGVARCLLFCSC